jgi:hypothetical protein
MARKVSKSAVSRGDLSELALQQIANCLGYLVVHTEELKGKSNNDLIPVLTSLGFDRNVIASILQTTPETVSVRLSQLKAKASKSSSKSTKVEEKEA